MNVDCISDTHGHYPELKGGDLLIVAGDLTAHGTYEETIGVFFHWLMSQKYLHKIVIAGNHDNAFSAGPIIFKSYPPITYLCDSGTEFEGLKIWGSPWTTRFKGMNPHCMAFTVDTDEELAEKWAMIPDDTDILITHSPPQGIFDETVDGRQVGSRSLLLKATSLPNLKLFVWGHIHESYNMATPEGQGSCARGIGITPKCKSFPYLVNASHVNERYEPVNKPVRIEI